MIYWWGGQAHLPSFDAGIGQDCAVGYICMQLNKKAINRLK